MMSAVAAPPIPAPRREAKRDAFVTAAREAFFTQGYGATSMSAIAARVGGSKTTLWAYFPSKEALFAAVVDDLVGEFAVAMAGALDATQPLADGLTTFGNSMLAIVLSPQIVDLHRLVVGEAGRFPELGHMFFDRGPRRGKAILAQFLAAKAAQGELHADAHDVDRLARQFSYMCQSNVHQQHLMGDPAAATPEAVADDVATAVATFVAAWGTR